MQPAALTHRILWLDEAQSTNSEALRLAAAGEEGGLWIAARRQFGGRGRSGRVWSSEPGNLHASLLLRFPAPVPAAYQLSLVAGVAVIDAIGAAMPLAVDAGLRLKWPNDVLIGGRKTGGVLIESRTLAGDLAAVVGIGLNLARRPDGLEAIATHLGAFGTAPEPARMLEALALAMTQWIAAWQVGAGFPAIREAWLARAGAIGEAMSVHQGTRLVEGRFAGLSEDGALLIQGPTGEISRLSYGDVTLEA